MLMENDWVRRFGKRTAAVEHVRQSKDYKNANYRPQSPNPWDMSVSKREWEAQVQAWRRELRDAAKKAALDPVYVLPPPELLVDDLRPREGGGPPASDVPSTRLCGKAASRQELYRCNRPEKLA